jgi:hypothetical protein
MAQPTNRPSRLGYLIAIVVFVAGSVLALALAVWFVFSLLGLADDMDRVVVPGSASLELPESGGYTIFYEYRSEVNGREFRTSESVPELDVTVTHAETGQPVQVRPPIASTSYDVRGYAGEAYLTFDIDQPGAYELVADYPSGLDGPEVVLAVGQGIGRDITLGVGMAFGAIAIFCGTTLLVIAIAGVTFWRRYRSTQPSTPSYPG